jgi:serine/threonine protein kinase
MIEYPRRWGAYVLIGPLGSGGMGSVFLALTGRPGSEKLCVVKRLNADTLSNPERLARFKREADLVRTLSHGTIAQTFAADSVDGEPFIAQEYIEGRTLTQLAASALSSGETIPPTVVVYIVREVARALAYAHGVARIVHRDIAPDNVMVTFAGEVRLIDFGIARTGGDPALTAPGSFVGRASYTAPEVLSGKTADSRSDIYSLGVLLWELLVRRPPAFEELQSRPAPSSRNPSLDLPGVDAVVARALAPDPSERFASAEELQRALGPLLPPTFVGDTALAEFVGRCYDVETERRQLRDMVQEASPLLFHESASPIGVPFKEGRRTPTVLTAQPARPRWWITWGWISALVSCSALVIVLITRRNPPSPSVTLPGPDDSKWLPMDTARTAPPAAPAPQPATPAPSNPPKIVVAREPAATPRVPKAASPASPQVPRRLTSLPAGAMLDRAIDDLQGGDYAGAQHDAEAVLRDGTVSQKSRAHYIVGKVAIELGRPKIGADEFARAIQLDPQNIAAANELSHIRHRGESP